MNLIFDWVPTAQEWASSYAPPLPYQAFSAIQFTIITIGHPTQIFTHIQPHKIVVCVSRNPHPPFIEIVNMRAFQIVSNPIEPPPLTKLVMVSLGIQITLKYPCYIIEYYFKMWLCNTLNLHLHPIWTFRNGPLSLPCLSVSLKHILNHI